MTQSLDFAPSSSRCDQVIPGNETNSFSGRLWSVAATTATPVIPTWKSAVCSPGFDNQNRGLWTGRSGSAFCLLRPFQAIAARWDHRPLSSKKELGRAMRRHNFWAVLRVRADSTSETVHGKCLEQREWVICISKSHKQGWNSLWMSGS